MAQTLRDDERLAARCAAGDRSAQRALYERNRLSLYRMALRYAVDAAEAEDFLHDGMLQVFAKVSQYRGGGPLDAWVRRVVLNVILQALRKQPKLYELGEADESVGPAEVEELRELELLPSAAIYRLIRELPLGYRTVFTLYYLEDLTHDAIADRLGISAGASKSQLSKAKRKLRAAIRAEFPHYEHQSS